MRILLTYIGGIILLFIILFAASCRTVKHIETTKIQVDSTAVRKLDSMVRVYKTDSAGWTNLIKTLSENDVVFESTPCDTLKPVPSRIEYYPSGAIKSAEGRIKSANNKAQQSEQSAAFWKQQYDSLASHKDTSGVTLAKNTEIVYRHVKRTFIPWWIWLLLAAGYVGWAYKLMPKRQLI